MVAALGCRDDAPSAPSELKYRNAELAYSLRYPRDWHLDTTRWSFYSRLQHWETTIANFDASSTARLVRRGTTTTMQTNDRLLRFPRNGVALRIVRRIGGPLVPRAILPNEPRFPLSLSDLGRSRSWRSGRAPTPLERAFGASGRGFQVFAWIGPNASLRDRSHLDAVLRSLRFRPTKPDTIAGDRFRVVRPVREYAVGSVTWIPPRNFPDSYTRSPGFFLVRAPGGFYALAPGSSYGKRGYGNCKLEFDRAEFEFYCPSNGARWDRIGRVIAKPRHDAPDDHLRWRPACSSHDGNVLVGHTAFGGPPPGAERRLWLR